MFLFILGDVKGKAETVDVNERRMSLKRKMLKWFQTGDVDSLFPQSERDMHMQHYFEAMYLVINCVRNRFDQLDTKYYDMWNELLPNTVQSHFENYSEEFAFVTEFYVKDID